MASAAGAEGRRFDNINLLRAFAALSVVVYHVIEHGQWKDYPTEGPLVTFRIGWYGVDLFFVISGFVIAYSALLLYRAEAGSFQGSYWSRRLTRILPLYLLTLFLWLVVFTPQWSARDWFRQIANHLTFTHGLSLHAHSAIDGVNWSLGVEMHFYLVVALLIRWLDRAPGWRILLYGVAISWVWRATMFYVVGTGDPTVLWIRATQLPGTLDEFAAGIFLAKLLLDGRRQWFARALPWLFASIATGYVAMSVFWAHPDYWQQAGMVILWRTLLGFFFTCVVAVAISFPQRIADRWLRPVNYLGETSYGIYLWHMFAVEVLVLRVGWVGLPALLAVLAVTIALAALSWHAFEKPFMRLARVRRLDIIQDRPETNMRGTDTA
jgi:peptidoglycan/LPS O-acetylase OafA/YrhL